MMSGLSPLAQSIIRAGLAFLKDDGPGFIADIKRHDWKAVAIDVVTAELKLAAAAGVPGAGIAIKLLPLGVYMAQHPHNSGEGGIGAAPEGNGNLAM